ncbi:hypothetical protein [Tautonia sociabilis]|uniref:Uncharacterized protein n=1 Tax=Tautonia sociabilis TaxID=2080755 RepID=A0A432MD83_9BACT|nr:hypothetical protein [Tautonia sociabilis]RUL82166.1 hypothetical protein TsocGM_23925 [Tautonia sociabilis]
MNRIALSIALAFGLLAGSSTPSPAQDSDRGAAPPPAPAAPDWFAAAPEGGIVPLGDAEAGAGGPIAAKGRRSYSQERALADARAELERAVASWLAPEVPEGWTPPAGLIDALVLDRHIEPVLVNLQSTLGPVANDPELDLPDLLYVAAMRANLTPGHREAIIQAYRQEVGARRSALLVGLGGFLLSCLAILSLYIRADEATKGYYTNRLRAVAVASAGAAGAIIYRLLA